MDPGQLSVIVDDVTKLPSGPWMYVAATILVFLIVAAILFLFDPRGGGGYDL